MNDLREKALPYSLCSIGLTLLLIMTLAFATVDLWGSWESVHVQKDSQGYLAPVASAIYAGAWDHVGARPFVYAAFVYGGLRLGGSLHAVIAVQLALYVAGGLALYLTIRTPNAASKSWPSGELISKAVAVSMVALYFGLSNDHSSSAYYLGPELLSSVCALFGLYALLQLTLVHDLRPSRKFLLTLTASACAALLVGLKPSFLALAAFLVVGASVGFAWQRRHKPALPTGVAILVLLALPATTQFLDKTIARKHGDLDATLFGPRIAFCNNAHILAPVLESLDQRVIELIGVKGTQETAALLREVETRVPLPILGFNGDYCLYDSLVRLQQLEDQYFGNNPSQIADTYAALLQASIAANAVAFAERVGRQLREFIWTTSPVDCGTQTRAERARGSALVERLIEEHSMAQRSAVLPSAPLSSIVCHVFKQAAGSTHVYLLLTAVLIAFSKPLTDVSANSFLSMHTRGVLLSALAWLSSGLVVALVHSFDVYRYVSVTLPLFLSTLGLSAIPVIAWAMSMLSRLAKGRGKAALE